MTQTPPPDPDEWTVDPAYELTSTSAAEPASRETAELAPAEAAEPASPSGKRSGLPKWLPIALVVAVVAAAVGFFVVPRLIKADPLDAVGPQDSPARKVAAALSKDLTCTAGEISDERGVLACFRHQDDSVTMVFVQADRDGQVASYTVEVHPLIDGAEVAGTIPLANQIAAIVTPKQDFTACSHDRSTPYFCFEEFATWRSDSLKPVTSTGEKKRLPKVETLEKDVEKLGFDCTAGVCIEGPRMIAIETAQSGLALRFSGPVKLDVQKQTADALLHKVADGDGLREWASRFDGKLNITVIDKLVVGYVPQAGGGGLLVVDEVAGVMHDGL